MSQYYRNNPDEPIHHDWLAGGQHSTVDGLIHNAVAASQMLTHQRISDLTNALQRILDTAPKRTQYPDFNEALWEASLLVEGE